MAIVATNAFKLQNASTSVTATPGVTNGTGAALTAGRLTPVFLQGGASSGTPSHVNHVMSDASDGTTGWIKITGVNLTVSGATINISAWIKAVTAGMATAAITGNTGTANQFTNCFISEFSGSWGNGTGVFTLGESATATSAVNQDPIATGNITTATNDSLLMAFNANGSGSNPTNMTPNTAGSNPTSPAWGMISTTYSQEVNASAWWSGSVAYDIVSTTITNATHRWDTTVNTNSNATIILALHEVAAGGGGQILSAGGILTSGILTGGALVGGNGRSLNRSTVFFPNFRKTRKLAFS